jgi:3-hydroxybutyryl-CoA dehydrogenase
MNKTIAIVGAGMMGSGIAAMAALAKRKAVLVDTSLEKAEQGLQKGFACIAELLENGLISMEAAESAKANMTVADTVEHAVRGASVVIEAIVELLEPKRKLFAELDNLLAADVPILSNTSGLRITDIASDVRRHPERTMTAHFWLPAHLVPLVEVVMWEKTDEAMALSAKEELTAWGKSPVLVRRDLPGQLANRIFQAVIREAANIVSTGLASAEDVDTAIKMGMGIRFPVWGPLEHVDAVGLDLCLSVQETVLPAISKDESNALMRELVAQGHLGHKSGQGIYDWTEKDMGALMEKRNAFIIYALKKLREWQ